MKYGPQKTIREPGDTQAALRVRVCPPNHRNLLISNQGFREPTSDTPHSSKNCKQVIRKRTAGNPQVIPKKSASNHSQRLAQMQKPQSSETCQYTRFVTRERMCLSRSPLFTHSETHLKECQENISVGLPPLRQELTRPPSYINCTQNSFKLHLMFTRESWALQY